MCVLRSQGRVVLSRVCRPQEPKGVNRRLFLLLVPTSTTNTIQILVLVVSWNSQRKDFRVKD